MILMADLHLAIDVAIGWILGRAAWLAVAELLLKPALHRLYRRADASLNGLHDRLPDLP
jgi:hypothetical protein